MSDSTNEPAKETKPTATKWRCPECKQKLTLYLTPSEPPQCGNPESHPKKYFKMEKL